VKRLALLALAALLALSACGASKQAGSGSTEAEPPPPQPTGLPDVARVACDEQGARVETPRVKPQPDGLHIEIANGTGAERAFSLSGDGSGLGFGVPPGPTAQVVDLAPGRLLVTCTDPAVEPVVGGEPLELVDEDGVWVSTQLGCVEQFSQAVDYVQGAEGSTSDPLAAARKAVESMAVEPDDVFERAGYADAELVEVRIVRDGRPIAVVDLVDDGGGRWLVTTISGCAPLEQ
jgi:hypothetical protein